MRYDLLKYSQRSGMKLKILFTAYAYCDLHRDATTFGFMVPFLEATPKYLTNYLLYVHATREIVYLKLSALMPDITIAVGLFLQQNK